MSSLLLKMKPEQKLHEFKTQRTSSGGGNVKPRVFEMVAIVSEDFKNPHLCYLCLCKSENSQSLFDESSETVMENIRTVFQIEPIQNEAVPDQICTNCIDKIDDFIAFREMVIDNHQILQLEVEKAQQVALYEPNIKVEEEAVVRDETETKRKRGRPKKLPESDPAPDLLPLYEKEEFLDEIESTPQPKKRAKKQPKQDPLPMMDLGEQEGILEGIEVKRPRGRPRKFPWLEPLTKGPPSHEKDDEYDVLLRDYFNFDCQFCDQTFPRFRALRHHAIVEHCVKSISIQCCQVDCTATFDQRCKLIEHLRKHDTIPSLAIFKCRTCDKGFEHRTALRKHIEMDNCAPMSNALFECHYCSAFYRMKGALKRHFLFNHGFKMFAKTPQYNCMECGMNFLQKFNLRQHIRVIHQGADKIVCDLCAKMFSTKSSYTYHYRSVHAPPENVNCPMCGKCLKTKASLRRHMRCTHQQHPMPCEFCSKVFRNKDALKTHIRTNHDAPTHICSECGKTFNVKTKLLEHLTTHGIGGGKYSCEWCDRTFNFASSKSIHKKTHHPDKWLQSRDETYKWSKKIREGAMDNF